MAAYELFEKRLSLLDVALIVGFESIVEFCCVGDGHLSGRDSGKPSGCSEHCCKNQVP
jgi:hypothetical protein